MSGGEPPPTPPARPWMDATVEQPASRPGALPLAPKSSSGLDESAPGGEEDGGRERRKLKNEDSSYDSDFDPYEAGASPRGGDDGPPHEDVSRTFSETLKAEFDDYVTQPCNPPPSLNPSSLNPSLNPPSLGPRPALHQARSAPARAGGSAPPALTVTETTAAAAKPSEDEAASHSLADVVESADYPRQVEFGVKLGYSEELVQLALTKLGPNPDNNELLDELIRLGAGAPRADCDDEAAGEEAGDLPPSLRPIIIDGSNVAMSHGNKVVFSCKGIRLCVDWFRSRGHKEILVFVPSWRKEQSRPDAVITDQEVLQELEQEDVLSFTPSRSCGGKRIVAYDDRYIIKEAHKSDGVIVSNDNYRDLLNESPAFRKVIESSLLMYSWVNGRFEPPDDPLGRNGPSLDAFLRKPLATGIASAAKDSRPCPYGRKCTYGNKCKYVHPERGAAPVKSVTEMLQEQKQKHYQDKAKSRDSSPGENLRAKSLSLPSTTGDALAAKKPLTRTHSTFPAVSMSSSSATTAGIKEGGAVSSAASESCLTQGAIEPPPLCSPIMKPDASSASFFSLYRPSLAWSGQDSSSPAATQPLKLPLQQQQPQFGGSDSGAENLHPKLQRQLSINPVNDDRLSKMAKQQMMGVPSPEYSTLVSLSMQQQQQKQQQQQLLASQSDSRACLGTRCLSPGPAFSHHFGGSSSSSPGRDLLQQTFLHAPLTRHSSSQEAKQLSSFSHHMLPPCFHNPVGRNLSAPDPIRGSGQQQQHHHHQQQQQQHQSIVPHITRLNSTSDSRLNVHGAAANPTSQAQSPFDCFDEGPPSITRLSYPHLPLPVSSPGPVGSRPMSPRVPQHVGALPPHALPPTGGHEDERLKIFYHLSQLFPEVQVRAALARNPDETDPTKICYAILSMAGCRPVSPPGAISPGLSLLGTGFGSSSSSPSSFASAAGHVDASREALRIEAYAKLSKLFPEDQVRNVLLRHPDETDPTKLCMLLMVAATPQQQS